jgi:AcrR family transcriptional regulator
LTDDDRPQGSLRERKKAMTIREIKAVAIEHLTTVGGQMTLRGVAREVGLTVQSLYHYFPSREDLITALIDDAYQGLADAVDAAVTRSRDLPPAQRLPHVAMAYRDWAIDRRAEFLLIYGTPLPGYQAPADGASRTTARRLGAALFEAGFGGWPPDDLARIRSARPDPALAAALAGTAAHISLPLPPAALEVGLDLWGRMHGLVMLEILGHLPGLGPNGAGLFLSAMTRAADEVERLRTTGR